MDSKQSVISNDVLGKGDKQGIPNLEEFSSKIFESGDSPGEVKDSVSALPADKMNRSRLSSKQGVKSLSSISPSKRQDEFKTLGEIKVELTLKQKQEIKDAFIACDAEGTGYIATGDLKIALRALGYEPRKNEIKKIIEKVDRNNTGKICFTAFVEVISIKLTEKDSREEILKAYKLFDRDQTGMITYENLKQIAIELGEDLNDEEIREMIDEADLDHNGGISQDEFFRIMKKTSLY